MASIGVDEYPKTLIVMLEPEMMNDIRVNLLCSVFLVSIFFNKGIDQNIRWQSRDKSFA
jgi:hypothetical protein